MFCKKEISTILLIVVLFLSINISCAVKKKQQTHIEPVRKIKLELAKLLDDAYNIYKVQNTQNLNPTIFILDFRSFESKDTTFLSKVISETLQNIIIAEKPEFILADNLLKTKLYLDESLKASHLDNYNNDFINKVSALTKSNLLVDGYIKEETEKREKFITIVMRFYDEMGKQLTELSLPRIEKGILISQIDPYQTLKMVVRKKEPTIKEGKLTIVFKTDIEDSDLNDSLRESLSRSITSEDFTHEYKILLQQQQSESLAIPQKIVCKIDNYSCLATDGYIENDDIEEKGGVLLERDVLAGWHKIEISYDIAHKESDCDPISEILQTSRNCWINVKEDEEVNLLIYNKISLSAQQKPYSEVRFLSKKAGSNEVSEKECFNEKNVIR